MRLRDLTWDRVREHLAKGGTINGGQRELPVFAEPKQPEKKSKNRYASGKRADLDNRYFRSSWEANVARYLNFLQSKGKILKWEYEVDEFEFPVKRGRGKTCKPDFKVWLTVELFEYWEIKGYLDKVSATKLKRMQMHYPQYQIVLYDRRKYTEEICPFKSLLPGWETGEE